MTLLSRVAPSAAILLAVLVCALPWGLAPELRLIPPMVAYAVIHRCVERRGGYAPDWLVFLAGFATDVVGQGPLGYWSLIYLCGFTMVRSATANHSPGALAGIGLFVVTVACLTLMQWSVASIYYLRAVDVWPLAAAAGTATVAYLLLMLLLPERRSSLPPRINSRLERGR